MNIIKFNIKKKCVLISSVLQNYIILHSETCHLLLGLVSMVTMNYLPLYPVHFKKTVK